MDLNYIGNLFYTADINERIFWDWTTTFLVTLFVLFIFQSNRQFGFSMQLQEHASKSVTLFGELESIKKVQTDHHKAQEKRLKSINKTLELIYNKIV